MNRAPKFCSAKKLILSAVLLLALTPATPASANPKRVALLINVRDSNHTEFTKVTKLLKNNFDKIIIMDKSQRKDLIPSKKNVRKILKSIGKTEPEFLLVYYFGYGKSNRVDFDKRSLSRNILWFWIEENAKTSFTIMDMTKSPGKKSPITSLKDVPASPPHYYLLNRQKGFLEAFRGIIQTHRNKDLNLNKFYGLITSHYMKQIKADISLIEITPLPDENSKLVISAQTAARRPAVKKKTNKRVPKKVTKTKPKPVVQKKPAKPIKTAKVKPQKPKKPAPKKPVKTQPKPATKKTTKTLRVIPVKPGYFKEASIKAEFKTFDLQGVPGATSTPVDGNKVAPFLSGSIMFGINVEDGSIVWKVPIDKRLSEYGTNFVDDKYVFALLQNEFNGSGMLKVIRRSSGVIVNSRQIWGDLTYYQQYQQPFVTARINGNYCVFLVLRKPDRTSEIRKITYNPQDNKLSQESYDLDYQLSSPLGYQENLKSIFWGGKRERETILGQLELATGRKKDYVLTAPNADYTDYIIEDPPLVLPSGHTNLPHTLYYFVCLNKKVLSKKVENLIAIYQLKRPDKLIPTSDFNDHKLVERLVKERIIRTQTADHAYFDLAIQSEDGLKQRLKGFGETEQILDIWKKNPPPNLELPKHNLYKFQGRTISSPALFKDPQDAKLNYLYFFSAIPPRTTDEESGIEKVLTLFEPYFWQKGVYLGATNHTLPDLAKSNLLGAPLVLKQDSDYLMLMASDEVYIYNYNASGAKTWTQNYRYNATAREEQGELFYGISSTRIRRVGEVFLMRSVFHGHSRLYGFRLVKNKKTGYGLEMAWSFKGGDPISAPLAYVKRTDEVSVVSGEKLLGIKTAAMGEPGQPGQKPISRTTPEHPGAYEDIFAKPVTDGDNLYWVSLGTMFTKKLAGESSGKFADISSKITTGISFTGNKFCYGTESNGVELYNLSKDNYYSFFNMNDRVSSTPIINKDTVYFATESDSGNYFYAMKLDNSNHFMLPSPGWVDLDKAFTSNDSWRFKINDDKIISQPEPGRIGKTEVIFAGTAAGEVYAFDQNGKKNKKGELERPVWKCKLPRMDESITFPLIYDTALNLLYCMGNRGKVYVLEPGKGVEAVVFTIGETDDYHDFKPTAMTLSGGNLCFSVTTKKLASVFYCLNYNIGKYLRVPLPKEAVYQPLVIDNNVYVSCRSGEIYRITLPPSFLIEQSKQKKQNLKRIIQPIPTLNKSGLETRM